MQPISIDTLFPELLRCLIFPLLPPPSLRTCLFVSRRFYTIVLSISGFKSLLRNVEQQSQLMELYRMGSLPLLEWFNEQLKYPVIFLRNKEDCLTVAAEGKIELIEKQYEMNYN